MVRPVRVSMKVGRPISHLPGMKEEMFKNKVDNFQLNRGLFRLFNFRVRKNSKVKCVLVGAISRWCDLLGSLSKTPYCLEFGVRWLN